MSTADTLTFVYLIAVSAASGIFTVIAFGWVVRELWRGYQARREVREFLETPEAKASVWQHLRKMRRELDRTKPIWRGADEPDP